MRDEVRIAHASFHPSSLIPHPSSLKSPLTPTLSPGVPRARERTSVQPLKSSEAVIAQAAYRNIAPSTLPSPRTSPGPIAPVRSTRRRYAGCSTPDNAP